MKNIKLAVLALFLFFLSSCMLPAKGSNLPTGKPVAQKKDVHPATVAPPQKAPTLEVTPTPTSEPVVIEQIKPPAWCLDLPSNLACVPDGKGSYSVQKLLVQQEPAPKPAPTSQPTATTNNLDTPADTSDPTKVPATKADIADLQQADQELHSIDIKIFDYLKAVKGGWAIGGYSPTKIYADRYAICSTGHMVKVNNPSSRKYRLMYFDVGPVRLVSERPLNPGEAAFICLEGEAATFTMHYQEYSESVFGSGNLNTVSALSKAWTGGGFKPQSTAWKGADIELPRD